MHSIYPFLFLLWSLSSRTFAAAQATGLRSDGDIYTVERHGDTFYVYTPYYQKRNHMAITKVYFPRDDPSMINVIAAYNGREEAHADRSPRLHLSDVIQALASSRHANRPLATIRQMRGNNVVNKETLDIANKYYRDWEKSHPGARFPAQVTFTPSDPFWPSLQQSPFYKAVTWTFKGTGKTVQSISMSPTKGGFKEGNMSCRLS
ncbi:hypothetical protein LX36DRAFT_722211 [Colletotrichum falcatum]|nr:hypothetical protein LX36DRAFT_722211 [Colletotrichum falcatum]